MGKCYLATLLLSIIPSDRELGDWSNFQTLIYSNQSTVTEQLESGWHSVIDIIYIRPFYSWSLTFKRKSGSTPMWTTEQQMKEHLNYWRRFNPVSQDSPLSQKLSQWMRGTAPPIYLEIRVTPEEAEQGQVHLSSLYLFFLSRSLRREGLRPPPSQSETKCKIFYQKRKVL